MAVEARAKRLTLIACILGSAIVFVDQTVVNVALPALRDDLDASLADQQWVVEAYLLLLASLILVGGSLGDLYGRRRIFAIGVAGFGAASLVCAIAPSVEVLIAARGAAGRVRRAARAELAGDHHRRLRPRRAGGGDRLVDGRHERRDRASARRSAACSSTCSRGA